MKEYRKAGELFALLRQELGFGDITLATLDDHGVLFRWTFTAGGKRWMQQQGVSLNELADLDSIEDFAKCLASNWKRHYNKSGN